MRDLLPIAEKLGAIFKDRHETIAIAESSTGGLISAALLAVPGASAYFLGGAIVRRLGKRNGSRRDLDDDALGPGRSDDSPNCRLNDFNI